MADKKTEKSAASHKKAVKEFQKKESPDFQKGGGSDFQPRASNAENTFSGQDNSGQTEENGKRQEEKEDYHRRDTYRQSQEKGKYHKKRVQREHQHREKAKDTVFTEDAGKVFTEDCASEFTGSEKLKKKQKQAQKAAEKVKKARGKLPKKREYTLQRVFDEETGKGKYVVVPLDKEKPISSSPFCSILWAPSTAEFSFSFSAILPCTKFLLSVCIRRIVVLERLSCLKGFSLSSGTTTYFPLPVSSSKTLCKVYSRFLGSFPLAFLTFSAIR